MKTRAARIEKTIEAGERGGRIQRRGGGGRQGQGEKYVVVFLLGFNLNLQWGFEARRSTELVVFHFSYT